MVIAKAVSILSGVIINFKWSLLGHIEGIHNCTENSIKVIIFVRIEIAKSFNWVSIGEGKKTNKLDFLKKDLCLTHNFKL